MLKWVAILVIVPPLVNYASLKNEQNIMLPDDALHYDVGYGQRLMLRCAGHGAPTLIFDNPAGELLLKVKYARSWYPTGKLFCSPPDS